jgi:predicted O-methyltransferase YrrM
MTDYKFTQDWFSHNIPLWEQLAKMVPGVPGERNFLEIGSFEGRSAVWMVEHMLTDGDTLRCVDTWEGSEEHSPDLFGDANGQFRRNIKIAAEKFPRRRVIQHTETSTSYLAKVIDQEGEFDFIYIDGSHIARHVMTDACMAWPLLTKNGILVFDDYLWGETRDILHRPRLAVDMFINLFAEELDIVHMGYQFVVRKK